MVLLALVDADYKFLWVNVRARSSSDAQIFNRSKLERRIENRTLELPPPNLHYFLLWDNAFALMPWLVKPYSRRQLTREERMANYRICRGRRVVKNSFGILIKRFRVLLTTMEQRPKVVRDIVSTCVVLHNMLRSHQVVADRPPTPADKHHRQTIGNRNIIVTSETHRGRPNINETSERLLQSRGGTGWAGGQSLRRLRGEHAVIYQLFSGLPK